MNKNIQDTIGLIDRMIFYYYVDKITQSQSIYKQNRQNLKNLFFLRNKKKKKKEKN